MGPCLALFGLSCTSTGRTYPFHQWSSPSSACLGPECQRTSIAFFFERLDNKCVKPLAANYKMYGPERSHLRIPRSRTVVCAMRRPHQIHNAVGWDDWNTLLLLPKTLLLNSSHVACHKRCKPEKLPYEQYNYQLLQYLLILPFLLATLVKTFTASVFEGGWDAKLIYAVLRSRLVCIVIAMCEERLGTNLHKRYDDDSEPQRSYCNSSRLLHRLQACPLPSSLQSQGDQYLVLLPKSKKGIQSV